MLTKSTAQSAKKPPANFRSLVGEKFGLLKVVQRATDKQKHKPRWVCECECGQTVEADGNHLKTGHTRSCGCLLGKSGTHGKSKTRTYNTWLAMRQRCTYDKSEHFGLYGGAGIFVCDRWLNSFENFLADMGERPEGKTLDRINNDDGYYKENCRWATAQEQAENRRNVKAIKKNGKSQSIAAWCKELGINPHRVYGLIRWRKLSPIDALQAVQCST